MRILMYHCTDMSIAEITKTIIGKANHFLDIVAHHHLIDKLAVYSRKIEVLITTVLTRPGKTAQRVTPVLKQAIKPVITTVVFFLGLCEKGINTMAVAVKKSLIAISQRSISSYKKITALILDSEAWQYALLIRFDKPIGTLLLLWPTLISLWVAAEGWPDTDVLLVFVVGVFLMRSAGCAVNDYADRKIDNRVERTKTRPLASGRISPDRALIVFMTLSFSAFFLVLFMNKLTIFLAVIGLLLAASYPFMKRYHYLPQIHLGVAFGWAVPMAYAAQAGELTNVTWLLFIATVLWATAYDTMYAMVDRDDDIKIGVKSTAILFGSADRLIIGFIQLFLIVDLVLIGQQAQLSGLYYLGVMIASGFALYQQYLIKDRDKALCFRAFLNNNWFGMILFIGVFLNFQIGGL